MVPQYKGARPWRDHLYGERSYIILSFVAKTILSWIVFVGIFTPLPTFLLKTRKKERDYCEGEKTTAPASKPDGVRGFNSRPRYPLRR